MHGRAGAKHRPAWGLWGKFLDNNYHNHRHEEFSDFDTDLGYLGKPYDGFTRMYNYGFRDYNPYLKQWYTEDPIRDGCNWYAYLGGVSDPVNYVDMWGLEPNHVQAGTIEGFVDAMNTSPSKVGIQTGEKADITLQSFSETEGFPPLPAKTPYFNMNKDRYVYTEKAGWVDMVHFLFYAGEA